MTMPSNKWEEADSQKSNSENTRIPKTADSDTNIDTRLRKLEVEFLHGVPVKLPESAIAQIKQLVAKELKTIASVGYDDMYKTYDYNVIAEALLARLAALQGEE